MQLIPHGVVSCSNLRDFRRSTVQKNQFTLHYFIRRLSMIVWVNVVLNRTGMLLTVNPANNSPIQDLTFTRMIILNLLMK